jgi:hypothetical protein
MAGLAEARGETGDNFWTWREVMYRFLDRLGPDDVQTIAAMARSRCWKAASPASASSTTCITTRPARAYDNPAEMAARIAAAAEETGIGLTLLPVFYAHSNFGGAPPTDGQKRFIHDVDGFARLVDNCRQIVSSLPDAVVGIAPHSLRAVTAEELTAILPLAGDGPIHMHVAEQTKEVDDCLAATGQRPVRWLMNHTRGRQALVPDPCHPHQRHGDRAPGQERRGGRSVPDHRGQSGRRRLPDPRLSGGRRRVRPGHRLQHPDRRGRGSPGPGICPAPDSARAQRAGRRAQALDRRRAVARSQRRRRPGPRRWARGPATRRAGRLHHAGPRAPGVDRARRRHADRQPGLRRSPRRDRHGLAAGAAGRRRRPPSGREAIAARYRQTLKALLA